MRTTLLYLVLVGLPALGVVGVLRLGERLSAPPSIGGTWQITSSEGCALRPGAELTFVQSGEHVAATWPGGIPARGSLRNGQLVIAPGASGRIVPGCSGDAVEIAAEVTAATPTVLRGITRPSGCAGCPGRAWEATRVSGVRLPASAGH